MDIKEYILLVVNNVFRIYAHNQKEAISIFGKACAEFRNTDNKHYQEYWDNLRGLMLADKYIIIENTDFRGIRKVT